MKSEIIRNNQSFLAKGGEMGTLIRQKDWSKNALGNPETWPQSLRSTLNIVLNSKFPMFLWWGPELICFYNDAYSPSLGKSGKHPSILGQTAENAWSEIWHIVKPLIDKILAGEEATWSEDQLIPIYRNGKMEEVYWTFSYSPVNDESDNIAGVLVICNETTEKIKILNDVNEREDQLNFIINAADLGTWDLNPFTNKFACNERLKEWLGLSPKSEIDLPAALDRIVEEDRQKVSDAIQNALQPESNGHYEITFTIFNPIENKERRVLAKGKAIFNEQQVAYRFSGTLQDITEQVMAVKKIEESEKRFRSTVKQAPMGISILQGPEFIVEMTNETYLQLVDKEEKDFVGKPLFESLPEIKDIVFPLLTDVLTTGISFYGTEFPVKLNRYGQNELSYFNLVYHPLREENNEISGIIVVATEVTASVKAKHTLAESENRFRNLVMQSPIPMTIFRGEEYIIEMANTVMFENIWKKKEHEVLGKKVLEVFPELKEQKYPELLRNVYITGKTYTEFESIAYVEGNEGMKKFYLDYEYAPLFETDGKVSGIMITVNDITERVESRKKVEESEERLRLATEATELSTWDLDLQTRTIIYSPRLAEIFGHDETKKINHQEMLDQIHPDDRHTIVEKAFNTALQTSIYNYEARIVKPNQKICWIRTQGKVFFNEEKKPVKMIGTLKDITEEKYYQQELQEREQKFRLLADSMPQHIWTSDTKGNLNYFNQSVFDYSGLTLEQITKDGWMQIVHPEDREVYVQQWMHSITTGEDFRMEYRFLRHDGLYRWQLSRAIPQKDAFGKIQMWVGTSTDIQDQKIFTSELEKQVQERTKELEYKNRDLEKMNTELQSFAYVSSHDLQEPLRKIQTFATRIIEKESQNLSVNGLDYFRRMQEAAKRMQTLIQDLLTYSSTTSTNTTENTFKSINLNEIVNELKEDFKETLAEKNAVIDANEMVNADVIPFQFRQLMHNLISNALKFSLPENPPYIKLKSEIVKGSDLKIESLSLQKTYCHISVADNGIGFDPQYKDRIFEVFQRLHGKNEYSGTGIGLAIVKKIVENHNGIITATGALNKGATFDIFIPTLQ